MSADILHFVPVSDAPNRIRELRMAAKLSQQKVADRINVSKMTISALERGEMKLDLDYMERIARALGVEPTDLLPRRLNPDSLSAQERAWLHRYQTASPEQREQLERVSEVIAPYRAQPRDVA